MAVNGQKNLETVLVDFLGALGHGDLDGVRALLDPAVTWQGLREDWICHGPDEVMEWLEWGLERRRDIEGLELIRAGDQVVMGARGPRIDAVADEPLEGQIFNVFTLRDGRIVRIEDYRHRSEALEAAGVAGDRGWR